MHLKSLTLKGFKSFASATTLRFEPGITCVVGPNGSGKSNVVDALSWVMGQQGVKSLRGGAMEDVIFAGSTPRQAGPGSVVSSVQAARPPLGRAEVVLTIDNTDGALPIDYAEVTITRTMFRSGGSDYAINNTACRLLDVQELLSDSGIGREMHVIVGQGQLDQILAASPEDRRGFIEEAAGVLKHRKRKEKALRKLDAMQANLTRLQDLTAELRRQLAPLGRQAEVARRAATVQAELRDARLRLLADDLTGLRATLEAEVADETALRARRAEVEGALTAAREEELAVEAAAHLAAPALARAQQTWYELSSVRERLRGTGSLAAERVRLSTADPRDDGRGRNPDELDNEAAAVRAEEYRLAGALEDQRAALAAAVEARRSAEDGLAAAERRAQEAARASADRREGLARLSGQVAARRSTVEAREAEVGRLRAALDEAQARAHRAAQEFARLEASIAGLDAGEEGLDAEHDEAADELAVIERRVRGLRVREQDAERERAAASARVEALELSMTRRDGTGALLAAGEHAPGVLGAVAELVTIETGCERAIAAALGGMADAVAVTDLTAALQAIELLKRGEDGRAALLVAERPSAAGTGAGQAIALPSGATRAVDAVFAPPELQQAVGRLLHAVVLVRDLEQARDLVTHHPDLIAVTPDGDLLGADHAAGGSASTPSLLELQAAADAAHIAGSEAAHRVQRVRFELSAATEAAAAVAQRVDGALERLHESDARLAGIAEQLGQHGAALRAAKAEGARLQEAVAVAEARLSEERATLVSLDGRLAAADVAPEQRAEPDDRASLAARASRCRQAELDLRLTLRTTEERARGLAGRADDLARAAAGARAARLREQEQSRRRLREASVAAAVARAVDRVLARLEDSLRAAAGDREAAEQARAEHEVHARALRERVRELTADLDRLVDSVHRDEVARAEQRLRIEALEQRAQDELGVDPATLLVDYGPDSPVPTAASLEAPGAPGAPGARVDGGAPVPPSVPYVREEQEKRRRRAERALAQLGRINPLALEEFAALEERQRFLTGQLADLRDTRRDLLDIVREVDERVEQVFSAAYADTAREFEGVFARLFPGGEGRLVLTDPSDLLTTGIEVEARPPGKKIKRLSLLSGGERSLTAVALLVAIFKARPSPFYVLDEVEAALDDTNLGRLLGLLEELRESSQLLVVTHQKRTMEIADALYGVSMRGDGVTTVISQRLREAKSA